ncbi:MULTISPECIES: DUF3757 domain-containing protein [Xanthomonas]|uniref:DUF3757 domain-containing protein n=1 Tax=Xanthomonas TaxID=338 RepID=UPI000E1E645B|nr:MULTISPECIES: DUF3757 domain-containing protein [Xanthomonas]
MQHPLTAALMAGMLLSLSSAATFATPPAEHGAQCPDPAEVRYEAGRYRANVRLGVASGSGAWSSTLQANNGKPRHLASVLYYGESPETASSMGVLVNCTYSMRGGKEVDLAYFDSRTPQMQRNLFVTPRHPTHWQLDQPPVAGTVQFYTCTRSAEDCAFEPLRLDE